MLDSSEMWEFTFVCSSNKSKRLFSPRASTSPVKSRLPPAAYVIFARVRVICWYVVSNQRGTVCRACVRMCVRACVRNGCGVCVRGWVGSVRVWARVSIKPMYAYRPHARSPRVSTRFHRAQVFLPNHSPPLRPVYGVKTILWY